MANNITHRNHWAWVPSVYLAEGLPYVVVMTVAVILYKGLGVSNTDIAFYTSWLYLPWVIKPLWSPLIDILGTRRAWIWVMQIAVGGALAGVALTLSAPRAFQYSLALFYLLAFASATQDIAIDGFYMLGLKDGEQAFFVGVRNTFYRVAMILGQGMLVMLAGFIQDHTGLAKIELSVAARPGAAMVESVFVEPLEVVSADKLQIICQPERMEINPLPQSAPRISSLLETARSNNIVHGFYAAENEAAPSPSDSMWHRGAVELGSFLRAHFGSHAPVRNSEAGNIGVVMLHLSRLPEKTLTVSADLRGSFGFKSGEKNFLVVEGSRLRFTDQNWNQPAFVVLQLDPKLRTAADATLEIRSGNVALAWSAAFGVVALIFLALGVYHWFVLPRPVGDVAQSARAGAGFLREFFYTFAVYFQKEKIGALLLFLLFYRFAEAQLVKMVAPFLLDAREAGGLGLTTAQFGFVYGTVGIAALVCGGLMGGFLAARNGLKYWLWWMALAIHVPDAVFVYLAYARPDNFWMIGGCVALEQFGYGFGFTAYMVYMLYIARGRHATAHYAICTGFMALGMMLPGAFSGWLVDSIGYQHFFVWVLLATIPGFLVVSLIPLDAGFGKKGADAREK